MTSFIADILPLVAHQPETITALFVTSRIFLNSSIVPVCLSKPEIWEWGEYNQLQAPIMELNFFTLFATFSDTMQFTESLYFQHRHLEGAATSINTLLRDLIENNRYFSRTLKHLTFPNQDSHDIVNGKLFNIRSVDLCWCSEFNDEGLRKMCQSFPLLETVDLRYLAAITDAGLEAISHLKHLEKLNLSNTEQIQTLSFLSYTRNLKILNLAYCEGLSFKAFEFFDDVTDEPALLPLREIDLFNCRNLTASSFDSLQRNAPNLTSLRCSSVPQGAYQHISKMLCLKTLDLQYCKGHTTSDFKNNVLSMDGLLPALETLRLIGSDADDECFRLIGKLNAPIKVLELLVNGCQLTNAGFWQLAAMKHLENLSVGSDSRALTGEIISAIEKEKEEEVEEEGTSFSKTLKVLNLSFEFLYSNITDSGLKSIMKGLALEELCVNARWSITSEGLEAALKTSESKPSLETLDLDGCAKIKDLRFLKGLTRLKRLNLKNIELDYKSMRESENSLNEKLSSPCLEQLCLDSHKLCDDDDIISFPRSLSNSLIELDLDNCYLVTDRALLQGVARFRLLERLFVTNTAVTARGIASVLPQLPNLKSIYVGDNIHWEIFSGKCDLMRKQFNRICVESPGDDYDDE